MPTVFIPYQLRTLTAGKRSLHSDKLILNEIFTDLDSKYPGIRAAVIEDDAVKPGISILCGEWQPKFGLLEKVQPDTEIHIVPAISGGASPIIC